MTQEHILPNEELAASIAEHHMIKNRNALVGVQVVEIEKDPKVDAVERASRRKAAAEIPVSGAEIFHHDLYHSNEA